MEKTMEKNIPEEEMKVELSLEDGTSVMCEVITILEVNGKEYIALLPEGQDNEEDMDVWFYEYEENPDDPDEEPELTYIEDDEIYDTVVEAFDEYLDECEYEQD